MATRETIRVKIGKDGSIEVSVNDVKGKNCTEITQDLEVYLGAVGEKEFTADYYKKDDPGKKAWITRQ